MRSRPATRTAFACVNLTAAPARARLPASNGEPALSNGGAATLESAGASSSRLPVAVPPCETVLRRPQRPGARNAFTFGNRSATHPFGYAGHRPFGLPQRTLRMTAAEPTCAITGGVSLTPAVIALSLIVKTSSTENRVAAVRKLWMTVLVCGSQRKTGKNYPGRRSRECGCRICFSVAVQSNCISPFFFREAVLALEDGGAGVSPVRSDATPQEPTWARITRIKGGKAISKSIRNRPSFSAIYHRISRLKPSKGSEAGIYRAGKPICLTSKRKRGSERSGSRRGSEFSQVTHIERT